MSAKKSILICDDDGVFNLTLTFCLKDKYQCITAPDTIKAAHILREQPVDLLLLDIQMRTQTEGLQFISVAREINPDLAIVMVSGATDFPLVREAMQRGAWDYLPKTFEEPELFRTLERVFEKQTLLSLQEQQGAEFEQIQKRYRLIGETGEIVRIRNTIERAKLSQTNALILGETGTGKEVVAHLFRENQKNSGISPFLTVDAAMVGSADSERVLFGASPTQKGVFELAHSGIVFFDEISGIPIELQKKLLRVIETKEVVRLGSIRPIRTEIRILASTSYEPNDLIQQGKLLPELFQRLNTLTLKLPPLRDRSDDIPHLVTHFIQQLPSPLNLIRLSGDIHYQLKQYQWPGNVRELQNLISTLGIATPIEEGIDLSWLPPPIRHCRKQIGKNISKNETQTRDFYQRIAAFEKELLTEEYEKSKGNISRMAAAIGMDRSYLYAKLKEHSLYQKK